MRAMSGFLGLAAICLLASACGPTARWDKPDASAATVRADLIDCRREAASEAFRGYAYNSGFGMMGPPFWGYRERPDYFQWRQRLQTERAFYEMRLTSFCMRNKGYSKAPVGQQAYAQ